MHRRPNATAIMKVSTKFDDQLELLTAGQPLPWEDVVGLDATGDILALGMLADAARRALHGHNATYVRVATRAYDADWDQADVASAEELRMTGSPPTLALAAEAVKRARSIGAGRWVSAFTWADVERWSGEGGEAARVLGRLKDEGLDALAGVPMDCDDPATAVQSLAAAGFEYVRLTVERPVQADRMRLLRVASDLRRRHPCIESFDPLPSVVSPFKPTTGYGDVRLVALARLAAPEIAHIQVDWARYGPKLAQVALTFGADDVYGVSASDDAPDGRRRSVLPEIRRNIEAAGFVPVERDGRFGAVS
jgi:hypothetical protein